MSKSAQQIRSENQWLFSEWGKVSPDDTAAVESMNAALEQMVSSYGDPPKDPDKLRGWLTLALSYFGSEATKRGMNPENRNYYVGSIAAQTDPGAQGGSKGSWAKILQNLEETNQTDSLKADAEGKGDLNARIQAFYDELGKTDYANDPYAKSLQANAASQAERASYAAGIRGAPVAQGMAQATAQAALPYITQRQQQDQALRQQSLGLLSQRDISLKNLSMDWQRILDARRENEAMAKARQAAANAQQTKEIFEFAGSLTGGVIGGMAGGPQGAQQGAQMGGAGGNFLGTVGTDTGAQAGYAQYGSGIASYGNGLKGKGGI